MDNNSENSTPDVRLKKKIQELEARTGKLKEENDLLRLESEDLSVSLEKYQLIADFAHDWEMWFDPDGRLEYVSPSFQNLTGYAAEELLSRRELEEQLIFPDDLDNYRKYIADALDFVTIRQTLSFRILTRTKQVRWFEMKCKAVYNRRGKYLGQRASVSDITRLMQALGEIRTLSDGKNYEQMAKQKYIRDLESRDRELVGNLMSLSQKNETLQYVRRIILKHLQSCPETEKPKFTDIVSKIDGVLLTSENWDNFRLHFEKVHPGFFERLASLYPALTQKDRKICSYLRLQLATKEIATLMNITPQSAEISRVRLRKKMGLSRRENLTDLIMKI